MEIMWPKWMWLRVVVVIAILLECWFTQGCWEEERVALLNLKPHFPSLMSRNWSEVGDERNDTLSNCCKWEGVECNSTTGRVVALSLSNTRQDVFRRGADESAATTWVSYNSDFNASWFLPLQQLRSLDLSWNGLLDWVDGEGSERASTKLDHLERLDLSFNQFSKGRVLSSLSRLPSLKSLNLRGCWFQDSFQARDLPKKLEYLHLDHLPLNHDFLENIGVVGTLKTLSTHGCGLHGTLPAVQGLCKLVHLQELDMSTNHLTGTLPSCITNMTSLQFLDLSSNQFTGKVSHLSHLTSIQFLKLSQNHFQIPISLHPFYNCSKLKYFNIENNEMYVETEPDSLIPKFQLSIVNLYTSQGYATAFPNFLYYQHELLEVHISNHITGDGFPSWLLKNNSRLTKLILVNNSLSGPLQLPSEPHLHLSYLDISENYLHGHIREKIDTIFPGLSFLNMSSNGLEGGILTSIGDMSSLRTLDLSNNYFSGSIPEQLAMNCSSLKTLILSNNSFHGQILSSKSNLRNLTTLLLNNNLFTGGLPNSLQNNSFLEVLDLSHNQLSGRIPQWIGNLRHLKVLDLSHNNISGILPIGFSPPFLEDVHLSNNKLQGPLRDAFLNSPNLITVDLSHNRLNGEIFFTKIQWHSQGFFVNRFHPSMETLRYLFLNNNNFEGHISEDFCYYTDLRFLDLKHNNFSGSIPSCFDGTQNLTVPLLGFLPREPVDFTTKNNPYSYKGKILALMSGFDLSCNRLTGEIPQQIGNLAGLRALNFSHNSLTGPIPPALSNLTEIESLDLSHNRLSGKIPSQLMTGLDALEVFSVAHNNLSGKIPDPIKQFATFDEHCYEGNPFLCGAPLARSCIAMGSPSPTTLTPRGDVDDRGFIEMDDFCVTFLASYVCVLLGILAVFVINPHWRRTWLIYVEMTTASVHYYIVDIFLKLSRSRIII